ncbi:HNH endonuclease [Leptolyngbya sp. GGD]|uniref:HNH endonuclease n=1 Tax=Leptolyngbya sp. GGD TaxID=2997907 RepID=UPI00227B16A1|nr:HNH endonuclease [Leptolyngbya sp. GGD]MCY6492037.1 HNH endonuclease [Leptolyngbya sp. GGD]
MTISEALRRQIIEEAGHRCEYCKTSSRLIGMPLIMEHVFPKSLGGQDDRSNLAASCYRCNEFKGARTDARDPETGQLVPLFNLRMQTWSDHFTWGNGGTHLLGITSTGRATVISLRLNNENIVEARAIWIEFGWHPPTT